MTKRLVPAAAALAAALLAGCPLPQPLPDYPAGTITPPRILSATTTRAAESIIPVPAGCAVEPSYDLDARIFYGERITLAARWFVDYRSDLQSRTRPEITDDEVLPDSDPLILTRSVPRFTFRPYQHPVPSEIGGGSDWKAPGIVHVVELVVSNGFDPSPTAPEPNRTPAVTEDGGRFEIQTYRWTFVNVAGLPCPPPP